MRSLLLGLALALAAVPSAEAARPTTADPRGAVARSPDQARGNNAGWNAVVWLPAAQVQAMLPGKLRLAPQRDPQGGLGVLHPVVLDVSHITGGRLVIGGQDSRVVTRRAYGQAGALWGMWGGPIGMMWGAAVGSAVGDAAHRVGEEAFGNYHEAMVLVPHVLGPRTNGSYTYVKGMKVDASLPRQIDQDRGFGYGKEMARFTGTDAIAAPDGTTMLRATVRGATPSHPVQGAPAATQHRLQLAFAEPFVGELRDGSGLYGVSRVTRSTRTGLYTPATASLQLTDRLGRGLAGQHEVTAPDGALRFQGLETTASAPVHARADDL